MTIRNVTVIVPAGMPANQPAVTVGTGQHVFVYGTLLDPLCVDEVLGHRHTGERLRAQLSGFRRVAPAAYPYPFIVSAADSCVDGELLMDLSPNDLEALDRYEETDAGIYRRQRVEVEAWGCGPRTLRFQAHTYVAGPKLNA